MMEIPQSRLDGQETYQDFV